MIKHNTSRHLYLHKYRIILGIILILCAIILAFVLYPRYLDSIRQMYPIVIVKKDVASGSLLSVDDLMVSETSDATLSGCTYASPDDVKGKYLTRDMAAGSYLFRADIMDEFIAAAPLSTIPDHRFALSVSVTTLSKSVSGQIRAQDIVRLYSVNADGTAYSPPELQYVKVLAVYDNSGTEIKRDSFTMTSAIGTEKEVAAVSPSSILLLVSQKQALRIIGSELNNLLYFALVSRDDEIASEKLLSMQDKTLISSEGGYAN